MSTHSVSFRGEIMKISEVFGEKSALSGVMIYQSS